MGSLSLGSSIFFPRNGGTPLGKRGAEVVDQQWGTAYHRMSIAGYRTYIPYVKRWRMSIRVMAQVWDYEWEPTVQLTVLALADWANDEGGHIFPTIDLVAWKVGVSERTIQRIFAQLRKDGVLVTVKKAFHHRPAEYRLNLSRGVKKSPHVSSYDTGDTLEGVTAEVVRGDADDVVGVTPVTLRGDTAMSHYPSVSTIRTTREPSVPAKQPVKKMAKVVDERYQPLSRAIVTAVYPGALLTATEWTKVDKAVKELLLVNATPSEIEERSAEWKRRCPTYNFSPYTLVSHWSELARPQESAPSYKERAADRRYEDRHAAFEEFLAGGDD